MKTQMRHKNEVILEWCRLRPNFQALRARRARRLSCGSYRAGKKLGFFKKKFRFLKVFRFFRFQCRNKTA